MLKNFLNYQKDAYSYFENSKILLRNYKLGNELGFKKISDSEACLDIFYGKLQLEQSKSIAQAYWASIWTI